MGDLVAAVAHDYTTLRATRLCGYAHFMFSVFRAGRWWPVPRSMAEIAFDATMTVSRHAYLDRAMATWVDNMSYFNNTTQESLTSVQSVSIFRSKLTSLSLGNGADDDAGTL